MELITYIIIKPFILIFETGFTVMGHIMGYGSNLVMTSLFGLLFFMPFYLETKLFQEKHFSRDVFSGKKKSFRDYIFAIVSCTLPIFSQIIVFLSLYTFIKEIDGLAGEKFLFISDLSKPDAFVGGVVNILPVLFFLISSVPVLAGKKSIEIKIVSLAETMILTIILYDMPSGVLVFWILFALFRACFEVLKVTYSILRKKGIIKGFKFGEESLMENKPDYLLYFSGLGYMILLAGFYIPTNIIKISTQEFVDITDMFNPMFYILYSMALSIGMFGILGTGYYLLGNNIIKLLLEKIVWILAGIFSVNYILSGAYQGEIGSNLVYFDPREFDTMRVIFSIALALGVSFVFLILIKKKKEYMKLIAFVQFAVLTVSVVINTVIITNEYNHMSYLKNEQEDVKITLGKNGKNVVVLIMDRALGPVVPFLFEEKPELKEEFDGFTYYPNTVSFGAFTNTGIPSVYGGYEYTPERMNARSNETLADKHNEALKVLPALFADNDYDVTIIDPAYAGYNWIPDLTIFDDIGGVKAYHLDGCFKNQYPEDYIPDKEDLKRNFFFHSIVKMMPLNWQDLLYDMGNYCSFSTNVCVRKSKYIQDGYHSNFMSSYYVLKNLSALTRFDEDKCNYFVSLYNMTPHMECLLQEPDYVPVKHVDNRSFHPEDESALYADGRKLNIILPEQVEFYHVDMATFLVLGDWFEYLKQNGCYDNTRIIIVSDHGADVEHFDSVLENNMDVEAFMPVLLVKDFDEHGLAESDERMTNADVPYLATKDLFKNPVNPYTGNPLDAHEKFESEEFHIFYSEYSTLRTNHGNVFKPDLWFSVKGNPYVLANWSYLGRY